MASAIKRVAMRPELRPALTFWRQAVQWADMDAFGHTNNVLYLRWMENARIQFMRDFLQEGGACDKEKEFIGTEIPQGVGPILRDVQLRFRAPTHFPQVLHVGAELLPLERADRFTLRHVYAVEGQGQGCGGSEGEGGGGGGGGLVVADGVGTIVAFDYKRQVKADCWPDHVLAALHGVLERQQQLQ